MDVWANGLVGSVSDQPASANTRAACQAVYLLNGHFAYYGITGNIRRLRQYRFQVERILHKWLERRTPGKLFPWDDFRAFLDRQSLTLPRSLTATPDGTKLSHEEPDARIAHVRVGGGRGGQPPRLPGMRRQSVSVVVRTFLFSLATRCADPLSTLCEALHTRSKLIRDTIASFGAARPRYATS
jgi:hypothetical protein